MLTKPGLVVRISGKHHELVEIDFGHEHVTVVNELIKDLKVGDYVILNDGVIIEHMSEKQAELRSKH